MSSASPFSVKLRRMTYDASMLMQVSVVTVIGMISWVFWGYSLAFTGGPEGLNPFIGGISKLFLAGVGVAGRLTVPGMLLLGAVTLLAVANGPLALLLRPAAGPFPSTERRRALVWIAIYAAGAAAWGHDGFLGPLARW